MEKEKGNVKVDYFHLDTGSPKDGWMILGPGGGGCVHTLTVNPQRPDTLVVSCDMTAGYITHNGGRSWREFNLKSRQYAYAFEPMEPETIYAGTSSLFRSTDNGNTWRLIFPNPESVTGETRLGDEANHAFLSTDNWPGGTIHAILVDPYLPEHIFIAIKKDGLQIFSSTDRGMTWIKTAKIAAEDLHLLALDPASPVEARLLFVFTERAVFQLPAGCDPELVSLPDSVAGIRHASCGVNPETKKLVFFISTISMSCGGKIGSAVWKSPDFGASWERSIIGLETYDKSDPPVFSQVSVCSCDARYVWLIAEKFPERDETGRVIESHGILKSTDEGATWEWAVKMDDEHDPANRSGGWAERDYGANWGDITGDEQISPKGRFAWDVVASPVNPEICYTMDFSTIFKTSDGGASWEQLVTNVYQDGSVSSRGIDVLSAYGVFFDPYDAQHVALAITDVGVFHTFNQGRTWLHSLAGVPRTWINTCYWIVFDPDVRGRAWSAWSAMHDIPRIKMFRDEFFRKFEGGICKTEDSLKTWQPSATGLPSRALCTHLVLDPSSPPGKRTLYTAVFNSGVYKSIDDGETWSPKNTGLDPCNLFAWRMALLPDGTLYLVVVKNWLKGCEYRGAVFKSSDGAETWEQMPLPEGVDFPNDLTFDPDGQLYLACWPQLIEGKNNGGGAFTSKDGGQTWVQVFDPAAHVYTVTVDPHNSATLYLATFHAAVYRSDDRGWSWKRLRGPNFQWCQRPIPDPNHPGMLYLTTFGSSIWYGPANGVEDAIEDIVL